ncbi:ABC transporter substrate-binding protein [Stenotrophomonas sp. NPDC087984]
MPWSRAAPRPTPRPAAPTARPLPCGWVCPDLFSPDGFTAAQMIVHAIESGSATDTTAMVKALEGWSLDGPKGKERIRAADHALLQPMFTAKLKGTGSAAEPELVDSAPMATVAPPVKKAAG